MNTLENNKLIAEFMQSLEDGLYKDGLYFYRGGYYDTNMEFHTSWDWLMPVLEEIDHLQHEPVQSIEDALSTRCIEGTYRAVVSFIKWYNKNKKA